MELEFKAGETNQPTQTYKLADPTKEGRMIFNVGGKEWMVVEASGDIYVRGTKVDSDRKVYECVREWLNVAMPGRL